MPTVMSQGAENFVSTLFLKVENELLSYLCGSQRQILLLEDTGKVNFM